MDLFGVELSSYGLKRAYEKEKPEEEAKRKEFERLKQFEKDTLENQE